MNNFEDCIQLDVDANGYSHFLAMACEAIKHHERQHNNLSSYSGGDVRIDSCELYVAKDGSLLAIADVTVMFGHDKCDWIGLYDCNYPLQLNVGEE